MTLRPFTMEDYKDVCEYTLRKEDTPFMLFYPKKSEAEIVEFLQEAIAEYEKEEPHAYKFAMDLEGKVIGTISLYFVRENGMVEAEIGWMMNRDYRGNGYMKEAGKGVCDFAINVLRVDLLSGHTDTRNIASQKAVEHLGLTREWEGPREYFDERGRAREYRFSMAVTERGRKALAITNKLRKVMSENEYMQHLGIEFAALSAGYCKCRMPVRESIANPYGSMHGGALYSLADITTGFAACAFGKYVSTVDGHMNFIRPAMNTDYVECEAKVVRQGKNISVYQAEIKSAEGELLETATFSFYMLAQDVCEEKEYA